ncbi:MAG TPA: nickel pincer cofactor biosynthesis protein LarC [Bacteroidota bacterium]|nr:nickel pincer cofactor biosynthesis protein LarC [Bacteroidota bacterium]
MIIYFDTIAGISGDMTLGALVSAGMPFDVLKDELAKLGLHGFELQASHVERSGIVATKIDVVVSQQPSYHRHLKDIQAIIDQSLLAESVKDRAKRIFMEVARAEAKIHGSTIEKIHFHEVGAIDSLVDIVGTSIGIDHLKIDQVYSSPVKVGGGGFVNSEHGKLPIPTPATMEILKDYPIVLTDIQNELTTPTGAAIIKALSKGTLSLAQLKTSAIGYGAGSKDFEGIPNLLRVMIGTIDEGYETDAVVMVETNIDDMNPEIYPYVIERLIEAGAHDAFVLPALMKKGRPGMLLSIIAERGKLDSVLGVIFKETTTLGVRILPVERRKLSRSSRDVQTSLGVVKAKVVVNEGKERLVPEFEECKRIAQEKNLPLKDVYKIIERELI